MRSTKAFDDGARRPSGRRAFLDTTTATLLAASRLGLVPSTGHRSQRASCRQSVPDRGYASSRHCRSGRAPCSRCSGGRAPRTPPRLPCRLASYARPDNAVRAPALINLIGLRWWGSLRPPPSNPPRSPPCTPGRPRLPARACTVPRTPRRGGSPPDSWPRVADSPGLRQSGLASSRTQTPRPTFGAAHLTPADTTAHVRPSALPRKSGCENRVVAVPSRRLFSRQGASRCFAITQGGGVASTAQASGNGGSAPVSSGGNEPAIEPPVSPTTAGH